MNIIQRGEQNNYIIELVLQTKTIHAHSLIDDDPILRRIIIEILSFATQNILTEMSSRVPEHFGE